VGAHAYNPSTWEAETEARLGFIGMLCLKKKKKKCVGVVNDGSMVALAIILSTGWGGEQI
jgi:hypothetical protein